MVCHHVRMEYHVMKSTLCNLMTFECFTCRPLMFFPVAFLTLLHLLRWIFWGTTVTYAYISWWCFRDAFYILFGCKISFKYLSTWYNRYQALKVIFLIFCLCIFCSDDCINIMLWKQNNYLELAQSSGCKIIYLFVYYSRCNFTGKKN